MPQIAKGFEGGGDAIWHPDGRRIWGGYGFRSGLDAYGPLSRIFQTEVITLPLVDERFYHLDTCPVALDCNTAIACRSAFDEVSWTRIRAGFSDLIEVSAEDASRFMVCNAVAWAGRDIVLQAGAAEVVRALRTRGFEVHEVETGEYIKSGGSVYCLKNWVW